MEIVTPQLQSVRLASATLQNTPAMEVEPRLNGGLDGIAFGDFLDEGKVGSSTGKSFPSTSSVYESVSSAKPVTKEPRKNKLSNSTSSMYIQSTIVSPNSTEVLEAIASVLHCIMLQGASAGNSIAPPVDPSLQMFDERHYVSQHLRKRLRWGAPDGMNDRTAPDENVPPCNEIFYFLKATMDRASFSPVCTIIALVLLNRLISQNSGVVSVHAYNWRLLYLSSLLVGQKIWDDSALANVDFPIVWSYAMKIYGDQQDAVKALDVKAFNSMERKFLELLSFNVYISSGLYAQFCFELRAIYEANSPKAKFPVLPLTPSEAKKLYVCKSIALIFFD